MNANLPLIRKKMLELYGLDIDKSKMHFSSSNYAFVFPDEVSKSIIRVTIGNSRSRQQAISEALWVDDLRLFDKGICEPQVSVNDNFVEEWDEEESHFRATLFRKARGSFVDPVNADNWFFALLGEKLGKIHTATKSALDQGIKYDRKTWYDSFMSSDEDIDESGFSDEVRKKMKASRDKFKFAPKSNDVFGLVHGDIGFNNYYVDANNIWVFDFDAASYSYYMYDIASALVSFLWDSTFRPALTSRQALYDDGMLAAFRYGYEQRMILPQEQWDTLEDMMFERISNCALALSRVKQLGTNDLGAVRLIMQTMLQADHILDGTYAAAQLARGWAARGVQVLQAVPEEQVPADIVTIALAGKLNTAVAPEVEKQILATIDRGCTGIVFDCADLSYISSFGIRLVLKANKLLNGNVKLTSVSPSVLEVFEITGLTELLNLNA